MKYILRLLVNILLVVPCFTLPVYSQGLPTASPEELGFSSARLERINIVMKEYVEHHKLAGLTTAIARKGKVVHYAHYGMRDIESKKPIEPDTIFRIFSMSKPITSVAVMMLYEEGHFQLNDPISKFIPAFTDGMVFRDSTDKGLELINVDREITIKDLLSHTSGLTYGLFGDSKIDRMYREAELLSPDGVLKEAITKLANLPLLYQPGSMWHYSMSVDVLGYLVEVISKQPLDVFFQQRIFDPLKMEDTGFHVPEAKLDRFAEMYSPDENGGLKVSDQFRLFADGPPSLFAGGHGLVSTASDYMRFAQMLLSGGELEGTRLLSRKTVDLMTMNHLADGLVPISPDGSDANGWGFGLGFAVRTNVAQSAISGSEGEFTWGGAANTYFWVDPKEELIGLLMIQFIPYGHYPIFRQIKVLTYQAIDD